METLPAIHQPPPVVPAAPPRERPWFAVMLVLGVLCLLPGLWMGLHADDWFQLRPRSASEVLATFAGNWGMGERGQGGFYRPVVRVSFALDNWIHGGSAIGCHVTNGLLFIALLAGVYRAGVPLSDGNRRISFLACAALLALSPVKNEALYWVSGRTDLLAALAIVWSFHGALKALETSRVAWVAWSLACLVIGLGAKEISLAGAAILPLTAVLLAGSDTKRSILLTLILVPPALGLCYFAWRAAVLGGMGGYDTPPRSVSVFAESILTNLSALFWPWQADGPVDYRNFLALPGLALVGVLIFLTGRRAMVVALGALLLSLVPISFIDITPDDGGRVLLLPLCFQVMMVAAFCRRGLWLWEAPCIPALALVALTLQPANLRIIRDYQAAASVNEQVIEDAWAILESTPENGVLISPEPKRSARRRVLDPGAALQMALVTRWLHQPGAKMVDATDIAIPCFALELRNKNHRLLLSHALQPWMKTGIQVITFTSLHTLKVQILEQINSEEAVLKKGQVELSIPLTESQILAVGVLAEGRTSAAPQLLITTIVGQTQTLNGWYFQEAGPAIAWMNTLETGILLPSDVRFRPFGHGNPFPLRKITLARYRVVRNEIMGK